MSVAVHGGPTSSMSPRVRRGPLLPLILDSFPVPPNHTPSPSPSIATSSLSNVLHNYLPGIGKPPSAPLPCIPSSELSPRSASTNTSHATTSSKNMERTPSPDISAIISSSLRKSKSSEKTTSLHSHGTADGHHSDERDSGNESDGVSDSSLDIHTPLPHLMVREGLLSPNSKAVANLSRTASPALSHASSHISLLSLTSTATTSQYVEREKRKLRHRNGKVLRDGLGLTTGLGWSDSDDEDESGAGLMRRLSKCTSSSSLRSKQYPSSIRSAPPASAAFTKSCSYNPSTLSRSTTASSVSTATSTTSNSSSKSTASYSAFSVQKPVSVFARTHSGSNASTASDGASSTHSNHSNHSSSSHSSSRKAKSSRMPPVRSRLPSIGETEKTASSDEFGALRTQATSPSVLDEYGKSGFNYSMPRSTSRQSMIMQVSFVPPSSTSSSLPRNQKDRSTGSQGSGEFKTTSLEFSKAPKFRHGMDARVKRLEEKMQQLQDYAPPNGSDTEREPSPARSRTPTPNSPGDSFSTSGSASSIGMPVTPRNEKTLDLAYDGIVRTRKESDASIGSVGSGSIPQHSKLISKSVLRARAVASVSPANSAPTVVPNDERTPKPSRGLSHTSSTPSFAYSNLSPLSRGVSTAKSNPTTPLSFHPTRKPPRPPPPQDSILPTSVEYAQLHPLTKLAALRASGVPSNASGSPSLLNSPRTTSLHPLNQPLSGPLYPPQSVPSPLSKSLNGIPSPSYTNGAPTPAPRLGLGRLLPKKSYSSSQGGIGAGGVSRV